MRLSVSGLVWGLVPLLLIGGCNESRSATAPTEEEPPPTAGGGLGGASDPTENFDPQPPDGLDSYPAPEVSCEFLHFLPATECFEQPGDADSYMCVALTDLTDPCSVIHLDDDSAAGGAIGIDVPAQCPHVTDVVFGSGPKCGGTTVTPICSAPVYPRPGECCYRVRAVTLAC